ncbi:MAG TPA: signal peptidase I [Candidatus Izemoplasmatales bacterium]|nr:signal peptidase I [Candidatus Izemoplasmatales bacterium]
MKKLGHNIIKWLPFVILGVVILLVFQLGYAMANGEVPTIFDRAISYVPTASMEDEIMAGDMIVVHTDVDDYFEGDVISFETRVNGKTVSITHRIVEKNGDLFTTKGDNNDEIYAWEKDIDKDNIIGLYRGQRSGFLGSVYGLLFSGNISILFILIIGIFLVIMVLEVFNIFKAIQDKKQSEEKDKLIEEAKQKLIENEDIE